MKLVLIGTLSTLVLFLAYISTRESRFRYERNGFIQAPVEPVFALVSSFKNGQKWNPFAQKDPNMKVSFRGEEGKPGFAMDFEGNREAGAGTLELLKLEPNQAVDIRLTMTKPFKAVNLIEYRLKPEANGTRFSWAMSGDGGFMGKLLNVFIDCEKMIAGEFEKGIENLKKISESK